MFGLQGPMCFLIPFSFLVKFHGTVVCKSSSAGIGVAFKSRIGRKITRYMSLGELKEVHMTEVDC